VRRRRHFAGDTGHQRGGGWHGGTRTRDATACRLSFVFF
jgi:hypothetical protein